MTSYFLLLLPLLFHSSRPASASQFTQIALLGQDAVANTEVAAIALSPDGQAVYVTGTTTPRKRTGASQFGIPSSPLLRAADYFVAKVSLRTRSLDWAFRYGTLKEDRADTLLLASSGKHLYVAGATFGSLIKERPNVGLTDAFIIKYELLSGGLRAAWKRPLFWASKGEDTIMQIAENPGDKNELFAVGYSSGSRGFSEAFIVRFRGSDGRIIEYRQWPGQKSVRALALAVAHGANGPIFVAAETDRMIGTTLVSNVHLFRFAKTNLSKFLGDMLITSFATEQVKGVVLHPMKTSTLLVGGVSKMDETRKDDVFVKRLHVNESVTNANDSSVVIKVDDVKPPEYTMRIGAGAHDFGNAMIIHPTSGALIVAGHSTGWLGKSSLGKCKCEANMAPFVAFIDPVNGTLIDVVQSDAPAGSWANVKAMAVAPDGKSVILAGKTLNKTSSLFFGSVSRFSVPGAWQTARSLADPAQPIASPNATISGGPFPVLPVVAGAFGGFVGLMIFILAVCCCTRFLGIGRKLPEPGQG